MQNYAITGSQKNVKKYRFSNPGTINYFTLFYIDMYGLLTKCEVKMAGYWPSSFFACLWTETVLRSINTQKKNEANIKPF